MKGNTNAAQSITVDNVLSTTSTNPVQNKTITTAVNGKQATLISGTNIQTINGNNILTSGNLTVGDVTTSDMQEYVAQQIAQIDPPTITAMTPAEFDTAWESA